MSVLVFKILALFGAAVDVAGVIICIHLYRELRAINKFLKDLGK